MSFIQIKENLVTKRFFKDLKKQVLSRRANTEKIQTVGVLTTEGIGNEIELYQQMNTLIKNLKTNKVYKYRVFSKSDEPSYKFFTNKSISWRGNVVDASLDAFLNTPFDLLLCYYDVSHVYLNYAALKSKATFKVGLAGVNEQLFDFMIDVRPLNHQIFFAELKKYLKAFNKI